MKTLEEYHKIYTPRTGWTAERYARYEEFVKKHPDPKPGEDYFPWYAKLAQWMESAGFKAI